MGKKESRAADLRAAGRALAMSEPHVTVTGNRELYIENHKGIELYTQTLIRVSTADGSIAVAGEELNIGSVRVSDIFISGKIEKIEFEFRRRT